MPTVLLRPLFHRRQEVIAIETPKGRDLDMAVRKLKGVKWSQTFKVWYLPLSRENYRCIADALSPLANLDVSPVKAYLEKRKKTEAAHTPAAREPLPPVKKAIVKPAVATTAWKLSAENLSALNRFMEQLKLKAYSASTLKTYRNEFLQLLLLLKKKNVNDLTPDDLRRYFVYCFNKLKLKENTLHSRINAIKFYFEQVLGRENFFWEIPRPKKKQMLPKVLSEGELRKLFAAATNLKHKAILFVAYSAGLRVSEVINLRLQDIDRERQQLFIHCSKGKKDRYVNLSPLVLDILEQYYRNCTRKPVNYVFEGTQDGQSYSIRSAQQIFQEARLKAGISKTVSFHALRHSFATHMLEKGIDVIYIKEILGHFNIKTTQRYLHVRREFLVNLASPIDGLYGQQEKLYWRNDNTK